MKYPNDRYRILAFSGGVDSTAILASEPIDLCVFVDYHQPAAVAETAEALCKRFDVPLVVRELPGMQLAEMADAAGRPGPRVVQARNLAIFALCANEMPEEGGYVYFGCHAGDAEAYPDCRSEFWDYLQCATIEAYKVGIAIPLIKLSKDEVIQKLSGYAVEYALCWSCYTPRSGPGDQLKPCGECDSCHARARSRST